jgi:CRISPR system Cascade subunit CasC
MNRDDLGRPKELYFGGVRRQRISSQCLKSRIKNGEMLASFRQNMVDKNQVFPLIRTGRVAEKLAKLLVEDKVNVNVATIISKEIADRMAKFEEKKAKTQLIATSEGELLNIISHLKELRGDIPDDPKAAENWVKNGLDDLKKELNSRVLRGDLCPEIQLFGRMMTNQDNFAPVDSPLQVMHAFTTHEVPIQKDYWTGEDDLRLNFDEMLIKPTDPDVISKLTFRHSGASMIESRRFSSGVYYHYHCIDLDLLFENMRGAYPEDTSDQQIAEICAELVGYYLLSCIGEQPTGNQTGLASPDIAEFVAIGVGNGFPVCAASAYEKPIDSEEKTKDIKKEGYLQDSIKGFEEWLIDIIKK